MRTLFMEKKVPSIDADTIYGRQIRPNRCGHYADTKQSEKVSKKDSQTNPNLLALC